jgi:cell division protein FtsL
MTGMRDPSDFTGCLRVILYTVIVWALILAGVILYVTAAP